MPFWSSQTLEDHLNQLVDKPEKGLVDCNALTLRVGGEIYITPGLEQAAPLSQTKRLLGPSEPFAIPPGQFAFLLTEEVVTIPRSTMGFISVKATYKLKGLVNVSGFHVDPGWSGPLIFSVFNAGPATVYLQRGLPLFLMWIANLDAPSDKHKSTPGPTGIPPTTINNVSGVVDTIYALDKRIRDELKKVSDENVELGNRIHAIDKAQNRILLGLGIGGAILLACIGVALRSVWLSFFP